MDESWPDRVDSTAIVLILTLVVVVPACGYWLMIVDIRRYLRALRGILVRVTYHFPGVPHWARRETPACLIAMNLRLPCTLDQVKRAYRAMAKELHPDRGGDRRKFMELQRHFAAALRFVQEIDDEKD